MSPVPRLIVLATILLLALPSAAQERPRVLLVTEQNAYIEAALNAINRFDVDTLAEEELAEVDYSTYDIAIFDRVTVEELPPISALWIGCVPRDSGVTIEPAQGAADSPLTFDRVRSPNAFSGLTSGIYNAIFDGDGVLVTDRSVFMHQESALFSAITESEHGDLIGELLAPEHRHIMLSFDLTGSNWPFHLGFIIFIQSTLDLLSDPPLAPIQRLHAMRNPVGELSWGGNRHRVAMIFQLARRDLDEQFVALLREMIGDDWQTYYDAAIYLSMDGYQYGAQPDYDGALWMYQEGMSRADALPIDPDDTYPFSYATSCRIMAAITAAKLGEDALASRYKTEAEAAILAIEHGRVAVFPALPREDSAIYNAIPLQAEPGEE